MSTRDDLDARVEKLELQVAGLVHQLHRRGVIPQIYDAPPPPGLLVESLELSARTMNALRREWVFTIPELVCWTADELLEIRNFGQACLNEIKQALEGLGLELATLERRVGAKVPTQEPKKEN